MAPAPKASKKAPDKAPKASVPLSDESKDLQVDDQVWMQDLALTQKMGTHDREVKCVYRKVTVVKKLPSGAGETRQMFVQFDGETEARPINPELQTQVYKCAESILVPDHCNLKELNEATLLENTLQRYLKDKIYTYVSEMLIAVNPFNKNLGLYDDPPGGDNMKLYRGKGREALKLEPHVYAVAEFVYYSYSKLEGHGTHRSQSLLISGESGSGKTETNKHLMQYLIWRAKGRESAETQQTDTLTQAIMDSNPVLEAFGNAATTKNNNSSRFGKYIQLFFSEDLKVNGAKIRHFLLEKSRVIKCSEGERCYHVFYYLIRGLQSQSAGICEELRFRDFPDFAITAQTKGIILEHDTEEEVSDREAFDGKINKNGEIVEPGLDRALDSCGIDGTNKVALYQALMGLLFLSNVRFQGGGDGEEAERAPDFRRETGDSGAIDCDALEVAEGLLGIKGLQKLLKTKWNEAVKQDFLDASASEVHAKRDAIIRKIYEKIFDMLVDYINLKLSNGAGEKRFIGLLDVFGFENFKHNSFEQLCINFANEKLHREFLRFVIQSELDLYEEEGLDIGANAIPRDDNEDIIRVLGASKKPPSLFSLMDKEHKAREKDQNIITRRFVKGLFDNHGSTKRKRHIGEGVTILNKVGTAKHQELLFTIEHFAGRVQYDASQFIEKNNDQLTSNLIELLQKSSNQMINHAFNEIPEDEKQKRQTSARKSARGQLSARKRENAEKAAKDQGSVGRRFLRSLDELISIINETMPSFVRCIKPADYKEPRVFDAEKVLEQFRNSGMIDCVQLMQKGYPVRKPYLELRASFAPPRPASDDDSAIFTDASSEGKKRSAQLLPKGMSEHPPNGAPKISNEAFIEVLLLAANAEKEDYKLGKNMVFFKASKGNLLGKLMQVEQHAKFDSVPDLEELYSAPDLEELYAATESRYFGHRVEGITELLKQKAEATKQQRTVRELQWLYGRVAATGNKVRVRSYLRTAETRLGLAEGALKTAADLEAHVSTKREAADAALKAALELDDTAKDELQQEVVERRRWRHVARDEPLQSELEKRPDADLKCKELAEVLMEQRRAGHEHLVVPKADFDHLRVASMDLDPLELTNALRSLKLKDNPVAVKALHEEYSKDSRLDFGGFKKLVLAEKNCSEADQDQIFKSYDHNGDGQLDFSELSDALKKLRLPCDDERVAQLRLMYDEDRSGKLNRLEFKDLVKHEVNLSEAQILYTFKKFDRSSLREDNYVIDAEGEFYVPVRVKVGVDQFVRVGSSIFRPSDESVAALIVRNAHKQGARDTFEKAVPPKTEQLRALKMIDEYIEEREKWRTDFLVTLGVVAAEVRTDYTFYHWKAVLEEKKEKLAELKKRMAERELRQEFAEFRIILEKLKELRVQRAAEKELKRKAEEAKRIEEERKEQTEKAEKAKADQEEAERLAREADTKADVEEKKIQEQKVKEAEQSKIEAEKELERKEKERARVDGETARIKDDLDQAQKTFRGNRDDIVAKLKAAQAKEKRKVSELAKEKKEREAREAASPAPSSFAPPLASLPEEDDDEDPIVHIPDGTGEGFTAYRNLNCKGCQENIEVNYFQGQWTLVTKQVKGVTRCHLSYGKPLYARETNKGVKIYMFHALDERNNRNRWIIGPHFRDATGWAFADWKGIMPLRPSDNEKHADPLNWMVMDRHGWKVNHKLRFRDMRWHHDFGGGGGSDGSEDEDEAGMDMDWLKKARDAAKELDQLEDDGAPAADAPAASKTELPLASSQGNKGKKKASPPASSSRRQTSSRQGSNRTSPSSSRNSSPTKSASGSTTASNGSKPAQVAEGDDHAEVPGLKELLDHAECGDFLERARSILRRANVGKASELLDEAVIKSGAVAKFLKELFATGDDLGIKSTKLKEAITSSKMAKQLRKLDKQAAKQAAKQEKARQKELAKKAKEAKTKE